MAATVCSSACFSAEMGKGASHPGPGMRRSSGNASSGTRTQAWAATSQATARDGAARG